MVGELWEEGATELIDDDDDEFDPLDNELEWDDDVETWCTLQRQRPTEDEAGE
jgi:hypothetical protein